MLRRVLFQVHLWVGLATGLYIFIVSLSGSLIVFRRELDRKLCPDACEPAFISWMAEFHDHLGADRTGLLINGIGAAVTIAMCITGAVLWWPGRTRWHRSLTLRRGVGARRFIRDLHSVLGIWLLLLILMWALTGIYFAFPRPFDPLGDSFIEWLVRLHFGRTFGLPVEALWVMLGLVPCGLFVTGTLMWWNRVLR